MQSELATDVTRAAEAKGILGGHIASKSRALGPPNDPKIIPRECTLNRGFSKHFFSSYDRPANSSFSETSLLLSARDGGEANAPSAATVIPKQYSSS